MAELHPSILVQETIDEFGYDPRTLSEYSSKRVLCKCVGCGTVRIAKKQSVREYCVKCVSKRLRVASTLNLNDGLIIDIIYTGSICKNRVFLQNNGCNIDTTSRILKLLNYPSNTITARKNKKSLQNHQSHFFYQ